MFGLHHRNPSFPPSFSFPAGALQKAHVLLVGAGGLGSPAALYLAAAGVGLMSIADSDTIEESNLQRQVIHSEAGVGQSKALSAASACLRLNSRVRVIPLPAVTPANVADVVRMHTIVVRVCWAAASVVAGAPSIFCRSLS